MKRRKVIVPIPMDEAGVGAWDGAAPADFIRAAFKPELRPFYDHKTGANMLV